MDIWLGFGAGAAVGALIAALGVSMLLLRRQRALEAALKAVRTEAQTIAEQLRQLHAAQTQLTESHEQLQRARHEAEQLREELAVVRGTLRQLGAENDRLKMDLLMARAGQSS